MSRSLSLVGLAALIVAPLIAFAPPAQAQIGNIFSDPPPRPPGMVPRGAPPPADDEEEEVPDLPPQGRVLPAPNRAMQGSAMPGPVQSQPLPPPPGSTVIPQTSPPVPAEPNTGVANAPAATNPLPGLPPGQRQPRGTPQTNPPPAPATLQPGDEIVTEPPAQKIVNKKASFTGLDKITGRTISFDADIGETVQFGALRVKTDACYTRPSTEATNTDAFVEVDEITLQGEVKRIFSGWMFAASPGLHAVEHPIYDIWLTDCKGPETPNVASAQPEPPKPASQSQQRRRPQQPSQQTLQPPSSLQPAPQPQRPQRSLPPPLPGFQQ
ncbi:MULTISPECIES: DUF2155 domain-containing protein [Rhodopseudomonas]|jgi:hypothetical protein|uniref:DUF2155 domain-containing protein n=1 Tax=Rhodopseudomonas palustris (strain DX-1) TaxID=652103 RepID=E6VMR0_RHOPX|nr:MULTISPECIES: DUF2155 domain-containing protein [Rhodopseudomonas]NEW86462.1 DUF2155 domain-containing protein [Rhodopseudomonas sp. WA056]QDL97203.1 DUF2155 domain-containing protein [Rhodopseudomonas palustris]